MSDPCHSPGCTLPILRSSKLGYATCLCEMHWAQVGNTWSGAYRYAVQCIMYYGNDHDNGFTDSMFDSLCSWLLGKRAHEVVPWLDEEMLRAGSGYDLSKFPPELHDVASWEMKKPCGCQVCTADMSFLD